MKKISAKLSYNEEEIGLEFQKTLKVLSMMNDLFLIYSRIPKPADNIDVPNDNYLKFTEAMNEINNAVQIINQHKFSLMKGIETAKRMNAYYDEILRR